MNINMPETELSKLVVTCSLSMLRPPT
jgi:hypothetical protein